MTNYNILDDKISRFETIYKKYTFSLTKTNLKIDFKFFGQ